MIEWLSGWLKEIILVILLATFIDLILPNSVMQRYVKVAVGLFLLMTILSPVVTLLRADMDLKKTAFSIDRWTTDGPQAETVALRHNGQSESVETILKNGRKLQAAEQQQSNRFVEKRIEEMVEESMQRGFPGRLQSVKAEVRLDKKGKPQIAHMLVVLHTTAESDSDAGTDTGEEMKPMKPIDPVQPVIVQIDHIGSDSSSASEDDRKSQTKHSGQLEQIRNQVKEQLMRDWEIDSGQLNVVYEDEQ